MNFFSNLEKQYNLIVLLDSVIAQAVLQSVRFDSRGEQYYYFFVINDLNPTRTRITGQWTFFFF